MTFTPEKWPQWCRHKTHPGIPDKMFNSQEEVPPGWLSLDDGEEINPAPPKTGDIVHIEGRGDFIAISIPNGSEPFEPSNTAHGAGDDLSLADADRAARVAARPKRKVKGAKPTPPEPKQDEQP